MFNVAELMVWICSEFNKTCSKLLTEFSDEKKKTFEIFIIIFRYLNSNQYLKIIEFHYSTGNSLLVVS